MIAELIDGRIVILAEYREKEMVKMVPGARWDKAASVWYVALSWAGCVQLRAVFGDSLQVGVNLAQWAQEEHTRRIDPCLALRRAEDADLPMFGALYPFQRAGIAFMATAGCALNADEMGLGKTVQAIASLELLGDAYPALIVCPNSMRYTWCDEVAKWNPGAVAINVGGTAGQRKFKLDGIIELCEFVKRVNALSAGATGEWGHADSATLATSSGSSEPIPSSPSDNVIQLDGGSEQTESAPEMGNETGTHDPAERLNDAINFARNMVSRLSNTTKSSKGKAESVLSALLLPQDDFSPWITTMLPALFAASSVTTAISHSAASNEWASNSWPHIFVVINYESLRNYTRLSGYGQIALEEKEKIEKELNAIPFRSIVADEAHRAKDPHAKQTRALWYLGDGTSYRFALTGTPVANSPEDVWTLMRFVAPTEYPWKTAFVDRYALQTMNVFGFPQVAGIKSEHAEELFRILDPRFIRRLKSVVLPQLPPKVYSTRTVRMETPGGTRTKQGVAYESMRKDMLAQLDGGTLMAANPLTRALRLCQFAACCGELVPNGTVDAQGNLDFDLVLTEPSCKVDALEDIILELGVEQAVVFAESRQLIEVAHARLVKASGVKDGPMFGMKVGLVTGAVPDFERQENVRAFQSGKLKVLLLTLAAGGEGLTLTAASTAIFLQRSWNAVLNMQAEDRIHRIGQESGSVTIIDVVTEGTIESRVRDALAHKAGVLEEIVRDEDTLRGWLAK